MNFITVHLTEGFEPVRINVNDIHRYRKYLNEDGKDMTIFELNSYRLDKSGRKVRESITADMSVSHIDEIMEGLWNKKI